MINTQVSMLNESGYVESLRTLIHLHIGNSLNIEHCQLSILELAV